MTDRTTFATADLNAAEAQVVRLRACCAAITEQMSGVIIGQDPALRLLMIAIASGGHALMVGVPGLGKTLMVRALAQSLGWRFGRIQFTPDLMPSDITGTEILQTGSDGRSGQMVFQAGPVFANLLLADEINRTPPKTQAALLEAMQERAVTVAGRTHRIDPPFVVVATQNPIEQEGTYPLPEAQLDRFMLSIHLDYPDRKLERQVALRPCTSDVPDLPAVTDPREFQDLSGVVPAVPVADDVLDFAVEMVQRSRPTSAATDSFIREYVSWGVGPRGAQHLVTAARAAALLDGRPGPEMADVREMALPVLRHRLVPSYRALGQGVDADAIVQHLVEATRPA